jgi:hypothetical protein
MARYELDTKIYTDFAAVEANPDCDFTVWQSAATAYWDALDGVKAQWDAIPDGETKDSAYNNADEMCHLEHLFSADNRLAWYLAAVASFE